MRAVALLVCVSGCGRIAFDPDASECWPYRVAAAPYANVDDGGDGLTAETAFLICSPAQLDAIGSRPDDWASFFRLGKSLELEGRTIARIGTMTLPFTGAFDGGGFALDHLAYDLPTEDNVGLFAVVGAGARFANLTVHHVSITGRVGVGGLVGISACLQAESIVVDGVIAGDGSVGGLMGTDECFEPDQVMNVIDFTASIEIHSGNYAGGVAGYTYSEGRSLLSAIDVFGSIVGGQSLGGFVGDMESVLVEHSQSAVMIEGTQSVGGIAGVTVYASTTIADTTSSGDVICTEGACGGIVGDHEGALLRVHSAGSLTCGTDSCGGLAATSGGPIIASSATGPVSGRDKIGGLVGVYYGTELVDSYTTGRVSGRNRVGGLFGVLENSSTIIQQVITTVARSYATGDVSGVDEVGGIGGEVDHYMYPLAITNLDDSVSTGSVLGSSSMGLVSAFVGAFVGPGTYQAMNTWGLASATCTNAMGACAPVTQVRSTSAELQDAANEPLVRWDFATVWQQQPGGFPVHR